MQQKACHTRFVLALPFYYCVDAINDDLLILTRLLFTELFFGNSERLRHGCMFCTADSYDGRV